MESALDLVQGELNQIQAIGNALGAIMFDGAGVDSDHVGTLCFMVFHLGKKVEEKLSTFDDGKATDGPRAVAGDSELDPVTKENILRDAKNLQDMGSQIQLVAESLCHDLGLELPPNIKKKIVEEQAARGAAQGGAA